MAGRNRAFPILYMNRRVYIHSGFPVMFPVFKLYMLCLVFIFMSTLILPFSMIWHMTYKQTFNPNSSFLHTLTEIFILIKLIIFTTLKSVKKISSYISYFPYRKSSRCVFIMFNMLYFPVTMAHLQTYLIKC